MRRSLGLVSVVGLACTVAGADVVTQWNGLLLDSVTATSLPPPRASRSMAMVHLAVYDAVNSIGGAYAPYHVDIDAPIGTSKEAAAAVAAHDVMVHLFQHRAGIFDAALIGNLNSIPDGQGKEDGIALGRHVASQIINLRANDGSNSHKIYIPGNDPAIGGRRLPDSRPRCYHSGPT